MDTNPRPSPVVKPMTTPQGIRMSLRASRIYGWLNARGLYITTFSTDQTVDEYAVRLERAAADLQVWIGLQRATIDTGSSVPSLPKLDELESMARDLESIRGRGTSSRILGKGER